MSQEEVEQLLHGFTVPNPNYKGIPSTQSEMDKLLGGVIDDKNEITLNVEERLIRGRYPYLEELMLEVPPKLKDLLTKIEKSAAVQEVNTISIDITRGEYLKKLYSESQFFKYRGGKNTLYINYPNDLIKKLLESQSESSDSEFAFKESIFPNIFRLAIITSTLNKCLNFDSVGLIHPEQITPHEDMYNCTFDILFTDGEIKTFRVLMPYETICRNKDLFTYGPKEERMDTALDDIMVDLYVEFDKKKISLRELKALKFGSVIELDSFVGEPVSIFAGGKKIATGEMLIVNEHNGVRIKEIV